MSVGHDHQNVSQGHEEYCKQRPNHDKTGLGWNTELNDGHMRAAMPLEEPKSAASLCSEKKSSLRTTSRQNMSFWHAWLSTYSEVLRAHLHSSVHLAFARPIGLLEWISAFQALLTDMRVVHIALL